MIREILEYSQIDPALLNARTEARKIFETFRLTEDPLMKKVRKEEVFEAMISERRLRIRSRARQAVGVLQGLHFGKN